MRTDPRIPVKTIPPKKWALPLPSLKDRNVQDTHRSMAYEDGNTLLESLGFTRLHTQTGVGISSLPYMRDEEFQRYQADPEAYSEEYVLWTHPCGVLVMADSYSSGGYVSSETQEFVPRTRKMNSMDVYIQLDLGAGRNNASAGFIEVRGSGGNSILLDGTNVRTVHTDVINGHEGLVRFLSQAQTFGKFLPFEQWDPAAFIYLRDEHFITVPVNEHTRGKSKDSIAELIGEDLLAGQQRVIATLPPGLKEVMAVSVQSIDVKANLNTRRWMPVEHTLEYFSHTQEAGGKRFPPPAMRELHKHWSAVALGEVDGGPDTWRWAESGPGGTCLPAALLYSNQINNNHDKLIQLLKLAPPDILQRWLLPDADGYTLPLRVLERVIGGNTFDVFSGEAKVTLERFSEVLTVIHERMGPDGFVLSSPTRSAIGLLLEQPGHSDFEARRHEAAREAFFNLLEQLRGYGVEWIKDLRWTTPFHMLKDNESPRLFRHDGTVTEDMLLGVFDKGQVPAAVREVAVWVRSKQLDAVLPGSAPTPSTPPRMRL